MMAGGRPKIWETPKQLSEVVENYFAKTLRPTLAGLAVSLGIDRKTLYNYEERDEFFHIIKAARQRVEAIYEERAIYEPQPTGVIFALKNMGWSDSNKIDHTTNGKDIKAPDLSKLTDDELRSIAELQRKSGISKA
jgi:hypothetical protein